MPYRSPEGANLEDLRALVQREDELLAERRAARIATDDGEAQLEELRRAGGGLRSILGRDAARAARVQALEEKLETLAANERELDEQLAELERAKEEIAGRESERANSLRTAEGQQGDRLRAIESAISGATRDATANREALERACAAQESVMNVLDHSNAFNEAQRPGSLAGTFLDALANLDGGLVDAALETPGRVVEIETTLREAALTAAQSLRMVWDTLRDVDQCQEVDVAGLASRLESRDLEIIAAAAEAANAALGGATRALRTELDQLERNIASLNAQRASLVAK